jgi:hypothetical protein
LARTLVEGGKKNFKDSKRTYTVLKMVMEEAG